MQVTATKALIFDFDGLMIDTETPEYQSWLEIYQEHNCELPLAKWCETIGTSHGTFDHYAYLETQLGRALERLSMRDKRRARFAELMNAQSLLLGVEDYICQARQRGLKLGLASSSPYSWISRHLEPLGLLQAFDTIKSADDVERGKPDPALYLAAVQTLGVAPTEAIALEDSPNGVLAAKRAGLFCVAVPNAITRELSFDLADLQVASLAELPLEQLLSLKDNPSCHLEPGLL
ncbi:MAG: HAD family hydrolase [Abitibacteriaceae bacterium]|nr:HAD family hydrolase [Abditibacteriaceae bacterium]